MNRELLKTEGVAPPALAGPLADLAPPFPGWSGQGTRARACMRACVRACVHIDAEETKPVAQGVGGDDLGGSKVCMAVQP